MKPRVKRTPRSELAGTETGADRSTAGAAHASHHRRTFSGKQQDKDKSTTAKREERAGQLGPEDGRRRNSDAEGLLGALLFVLRKKKTISTAGANGGELDLGADAQEDTGADDANLRINALEGQPLDLKETSSTIERQCR